MGPSFIEAAKRGEMQREIERLKESVDYHRVLLASVQDRLTLLERDNKAVMTSYSVNNFTADDAYRNSLRIVESYRNDVYTRNIQNLHAKEWVLATIEGIARELQNQIDCRKGKL